MTRPIVRYHGGKWKLAKWIIGYFPKHRIYTECYGGGGSVLLRKPRSYAEVYNDLDGEIVNLFTVARDQGEQLREALRLTPFARLEFEQSYESSANKVEQARRTVARAFMGFGSDSLGKKSGFRACCTRSGTTPAHDWSNFPNAFDAIIERLRGIVIEHRAAIRVMRSHDGAETLHYVDPPYPLRTRGDDVRYRFEMSDDDHQALASALHEMSGYVVLSGYRCELYDGLYTEWERVEKTTFADGARERTECLWLSPRTSEALASGNLLSL